MIGCAGGGGVGYPQHPEKKQRISLKKPPRCWGVCGKGCDVAVSDDNIVSGTVAEEAEAEVAEVAEVAEAADVFSSSTAAISSSTCSVVTSLSIASV